METTARSEDAVLWATARAAREIAGLPGAPTPDWGARLAGVLTGADPLTAAEVAVRLTGVAGVRLECRGSSIGVDAGAAGLACAADLRRLIRRIADTPGEGGVRPAGEWLDPELPRIRASLRRRHEALVARAPLPPADAGRELLLIWDGAEGGSTLPAPDRRRMLHGLLPIIMERLCLALAGPGERAPWLSVCEQRVLELLAAGLTVQEIADRLGRSQHTIHDHVKRLHRKLGTRSRGSLIARTFGLPDAPRQARAPRPLPMLAFRADGRCAFVQPSGW